MFYPRVIVICLNLFHFSYVICMISLVVEVECITCSTSFIDQYAYGEICAVCKNKNDDKVDKVILLGC